MEDYACSTRTSIFMKEELLDVYQRYDLNKYAFTPIDDRSEGRVYWKRPNLFKYDVERYYRSQTWGDTVFAPVREMAASLTGPFVFDSLAVVSPLCDSCHAYYNFELLSIVTLDEIRRCFEIGIIPKTNDRNLVSGTIRIEEMNYSVMDMKFSFARRSKILVPLRYEFDIKYILLEDKYNLCYEMVMKNVLVIPKLARIDVVQKIEFWDYAISRGLPDSLFEGRKIDIGNAKGQQSDEPFTLASLSQQMEAQTSNRYKYSNRMIAFAGLWDTFTLNRVEGLRTSLKLKTEGGFSSYWRTGVEAAYGWLNERFGWRLDFGRYVPFGRGISFGAALYGGIQPIDPTVNSSFINSFIFLFSKTDHLDYVDRSGGHLFSQVHFNDNLRMGLKLAFHRDAAVGVIDEERYRVNPEVEEGDFTTVELYALWHSRPPHLPLSRWSLTNQWIVSPSRMNSSGNGFLRFYTWIQRYQTLPWRTALEADISCGLSMGDLPLQHRFVTIHDRYRIEKDKAYTNWYGEGAVACGFSFFFGGQLFEKLFLATGLRLLTVYKLRFMFFSDVIRFYDTIQGSIATNFWSRDAWQTDWGFGLEGMNGLLRIEFANRYIGLRISPNFIPNIFE